MALGARELGENAVILRSGEELYLIGADEEPAPLPPKGNVQIEYTIVRRSSANSSSAPGRALRPSSRRRQSTGSGTHALRRAASPAYRAPANDLPLVPHQMAIVAPSRST
jgi:hypothetical protein